MNASIFPDKKGYTFGQGDTPGLTKLELFAAMAMQGFLANPSALSKSTSTDLAKASVVIAKLTLEELKKDE